MHGSRGSSQCEKCAPGASKSRRCGAVPSRSAGSSSDSERSRAAEVARVIAFIPDLLFGSNVVASLQAAGHEVKLAAEVPASVDADVLIVDLTADAIERLERVRAHLGGGVRTLA